nr:hypothetical protein MarFTME_479 [Marseillevirus futianmevirus]
MEDFLGTRELVSFCVCEPGYFPNKQKYVSVEYKHTEKVKETRYVLPNRSLHFLVSEYETMAELSRCSAKIFLPRVEQEFVDWFAHGKYRVFRMLSDGEKELKAEGEYVKGKPHGIFRYYSVNDTVEMIATFVNGRIIEFSDSNGVEAIVSRNKRKGTVHYLEKNRGAYSPCLKISRYFFSEPESEWGSSCLSLNTVSQRFKKYEHRSSLILPDTTEIRETTFSNKVEREDFTPNKLVLMARHLWIECPYTESEGEEHANRDLIFV